MAEPQPEPEPARPSVEGGVDVTAEVLALVADKTGYPADMLDLELDLEADLGIDTVKQAEVFATIRDRFGIERDDTHQARATTPPWPTSSASSATAPAANDAEPEPEPDDVETLRSRQAEQPAEADRLPEAAPARPQTPSRWQPIARHGCRGGCRCRRSARRSAPAHRRASS